MTTANNAGASPDVSVLLKASVNALKSDPAEAKARFKAAAADFCPNCGVKHRTITPEQCKDRKMSEKMLQDRVIDRAKRRGWKVAHAGRGHVGGAEGAEGHWITPMSPGWPDLTLAKAGHRLVFIELKREEGVVEPEQVEWLQLLAQCGARCAIIRPSDLREGRVNALLAQGSPLND